MKLSTTKDKRTPFRVAGHWTNYIICLNHPWIYQIKVYKRIMDTN